LGILETHRELLLNAARLTFLFGVVVGFLFPLYMAFDRLIFLSLFTGALSSFLSQVAFSFIAGILCLFCYWSVRKGRLGSGLGGVVAAALFVIVGVWFAGAAVLAAAIICSLYKTASV